MATPTHPARYLIAACTAIAAALTFAACSGSSQVTPTGSSQSSAINMRSPIGMPGAKHCAKHGDVRIDVDPCSITFSASNPGPDTVSVSVPKDKKGTISESDNCGGASGIATVTQGTGNQWTVTAGASTGSCTATFDYTNKRGKIVGTAGLSITNTI